MIGFNKFVAGDPKHDPALAPFYAYNPYFTGQATIPGTNQTISKMITIPVGAGGSIGVIRNPLGDFAFEHERPRIVAATNPIMNGFPDDLAISPLTFELVASFQALDMVFAYDATQIVGQVEAAVTHADVDRWSQFPEDSGVNFFNYLLRGPLSTVPLDAMNPAAAIAADYRFYTTEDANGRLTYHYGVPTAGPDGVTPNRYAPLAVGRLPRGAAIQPNRAGELVRLVPTPYNETPSLSRFPNSALEVETGVTSTAEIHSGALHETHPLVTYQSLSQARGLTLHYDSLRAEPPRLLLQRRGSG